MVLINTRVDPSMVIMKTLSNNRGISLIVLIVAMTLIALLGASFVSLMGSKQKGFIYQNDSYHALNIANAGMEYAVRYASDAFLEDTNNFFMNPTITKTFPTTGTFSGGNFDITYYYNQTVPSQDYINVIGRYKSVARTIRLSNFRRYITAITHVPDAGYRPAVISVPSTSVNIHIPFINNDISSKTINAFTLSILGGVNKTLEEICFSINPTDACTGSGTLGRIMQQNGALESFAPPDYIAPNVSSNQIYWLHLIFQNGTNVNGSYTASFSVGYAQPSVLGFNIP
jgi:hypothetical protein